MARIRSIKPEFPQSESMGRVSRDARLLFVLLWTIADDHGRARAHSRMLASLLFPYDDDAGNLMPSWLEELENEGCISLYEVNGSQYLQILKWSVHQKIDRPSKPQYPGLEDVCEVTREPSRVTRERSSEEGKGEEGKGREGSAEGESTSADLLSAVVPAEPEVDPCQVILEAYHRLLPKCERVAVINPKRRKRMLEAIKLAKAVCKAQGWPWDAPWFWDAYFRECAKDAWMRGEVSNPNNPRWKQNLDVLIAEDRFAKVMDSAISALEKAA